MNPMNRKCIDTLLPIIGKNNAVLFVGSGLSMPVFPSWKKRLTGMLYHFLNQHFRC